MMQSFSLLAVHGKPQPYLIMETAIKAYELYTRSLALGNMPIRVITIQAMRLMRNPNRLSIFL